MGVISTKERLIGNVVRLRRAERASSAPEEIATVRADLERGIGATVTRAMAARLLGVSQTALDRWVASADVPTVVAPTGRLEVPRHALVDLVEAVDERRRAGERHPLAAVLHQRRADAERMDVRAATGVGPRRDLPHGHRGAELRGLAYHRAVAQHLDERTVRDARDRLARWRAEGRIDPRYALGWQEILDLPLARIAELIVEDTPPARALRQSSPLAGALSEPMRRRLLAAVGGTSQ